MAPKKTNRAGICPGCLLFLFFLTAFSLPASGKELYLPGEAHALSEDEDPAELFLTEPSQGEEPPLKEALMEKEEPTPAREADSEQLLLSPSPDAFLPFPFSSEPDAFYSDAGVFLSEPSDCVSLFVEAEPLLRTGFTRAGYDLAPGDYEELPKSRLLLLGSQGDLTVVGYGEDPASGVSFPCQMDAQGHLYIPPAYWGFDHYRYELEDEEQIYTLTYDFSFWDPPMPESLSLTLEGGDSSPLLLTLCREESYSALLSLPVSYLSSLKLSDEGSPAPWSIPPFGDSVKIELSPESFTQEADKDYLALYYADQGTLRCFGRFGGEALSGLCLTVPSEEIWLCFLSDRFRNGGYGFSVKSLSRVFAGSDWPGIIESPPDSSVKNYQLREGVSPLPESSHNGYGSLRCSVWHFTASELPFEGEPPYELSQEPDGSWHLTVSYEGRRQFSLTPSLAVRPKDAPHAAAVHISWLPRLCPVLFDIRSHPGPESLPQRIELLSEEGLVLEVLEGRGGAIKSAGLYDSSLSYKARLTYPSGRQELSEVNPSPFVKEPQLVQVGEQVLSIGSDGRWEADVWVRNADLPPRLLSSGDYESSAQGDTLTLTITRGIPPVVIYAPPRAGLYPTGNDPGFLFLLTKGLLPLLLQPLLIVRRLPGAFKRLKGLLFSLCCRIREKLTLRLMLLILLLPLLIFLIFWPFLHFFYLRREVAAGRMYLNGSLLAATKSRMLHAPFSFFPLPLREISSVLLLLLLGLAGAGAQRMKRRQMMPGIEEGSAKWNRRLSVYSEKYADPLGKPHSSLSDFRLQVESKNMLFTSEVSLSMESRKTRLNLNVLVVGGSGTGKSRFFVKPNLLQANCSFVVTDPSGELLESCGSFLLRAGYEVRIFNLVRMQFSDCYNPFDYIRSDEGVLMMIHCLIENTTPKGSSKGDPFWEKSETALLLSICFYLVYAVDKADRSFAGVMEMLLKAQVKEFREDFSSILDLMFEILEDEEPEHIAVRYYRIFKMGAGKTLKSILISTMVRLGTFHLQAVRDLTSRDTIDLSSIGDRKTALFVVIPSADTTFNYLVSMMYSQLFESLYYHAENECPEKRLPVHVRFLLDEFANIGTIPDFEKKLATMRKYEISCSIILQNLAQLKTLYRDCWESITGNCDSFLFLGGQEQATLEYISKKLGRVTILGKGYSIGRGRSQTRSESENIRGRSLLNPDEISRMDNGRCILFIRGLYPFFGKKFDYERHPNFPFSADKDPSLAYDLTKEERFQRDLQAEDCKESDLPPCEKEGGRMGSGDETRLIEGLF